MIALADQITRPVRATRDEPRLRSILRGDAIGETKPPSVRHVEDARIPKSGDCFRDERALRLGQRVHDRADVGSAVHDRSDHFAKRMLTSARLGAVETMIDEGETGRIDLGVAAGARGHLGSL